MVSIANSQYWKNRYQEGATRWDLGKASPPLISSVKNVAAPAVYRQAMTEVVKYLKFLGFKVSLIKPSRTTHPDKATAKVYP